MAKHSYYHAYLLLLIHFLFIHYSNQLQPFQSQALKHVQQLLNYPSALINLNNTTDFCNIEPTPSLTLACYEDNLTQLHIIGNVGVPPLPQYFSIDSLFATLGSLSSLKVLSLVSLGLWGPLPGSISQLSSLEILNVSSNYFSGSIPGGLSSLRNLQTLILDHNKFDGEVPVWLGSLHALAVLSVKNNSLSGSLPNSMTSLENLRVVSISKNQLYGKVPDLQNLTNLQVLDLEDNYFGPHFPSLHNKMITLVLRNNRFRVGIPAELASYYQLQKLDISSNRFVGPFLPSLLSLPSISYLDISGNKLTGMLLTNMSCNAELTFVNLSANFLAGNLPTCLQSTSKDRVVRYASNCLSNGEQEQHPPIFCHNEALAVKVLPNKQSYERHESKRVLASSVMGGILGAGALVSLVVFIIQRKTSKLVLKSPSTRIITNKVPTINTAKLISDARYISETMKLGASFPVYRAFALEELKEATNNFDPSNFVGEGSHGQIHRGKLRDGTFVAIRSLKMKRRHTAQTYTHHIELLSKLRHSNLVSALGHCFQCSLDDSSVSVIHLIFEYAPNGTLRGCVSEAVPGGRRLNWAQRVTAAIGVAKGIQFLHTGTVPGVFSNNVKITDVLLDQNLQVKISSYNLPLLTENKATMGEGITSPGSKSNIKARQNHEDKNDVYDIGVILLEIIVGRPVMSLNDVVVMKDLLQVSITMDDMARRSIIDPMVIKDCSAESLKTVMELCLRCLSNELTDRPSVEDVLWNLQFALQVQDSPRVDSKNFQYTPDSSEEI